MYSPACADPQCTNPHALTRNVLTRNVGAHKVLTRNAMTKPTDPHVLARNVLACMLPAVPTRGPRYPTQHNVVYCICSQSISTDNHAYVASTYDMGH